MWLFQDFAAGSGPAITLSDNDNGTGLVFDGADVVDGSAVVTTTDGNPIFTNAAHLPAQLVSVSAHTGTSVTLDATPAVGEGSVRVWYLYALPASDFPADAQIAPRFVKEVRTEFLDTAYLNQGLNLSDLANAVTARTNLGFSSQTAGRVLLGDGGTTFTSDSALFFDTSNDRLGIGTGAPSEQLHLQKTTASATALIESISTNNPAILQLESARDTSANLALNDVAGRIQGLGRAGGSYVSLTLIETVYTGDGTTQVGDIVFYTANAGAPGEKFRIKGTGELRTQLSTGAAFIDADGDLSSDTSVSPMELGFLNGVTSSIQTQLDGKQATGNYITALTGDVTASGPGSVAATIANDAVTNAKLANMAEATIKGRAVGAGTGDPTDLTGTQATAILDAFTGDSGAGGVKGLVPAPASGDAAANKFLRASGVWATLPVFKAGSSTIANGATSKAITFATTFGSTNYAISAVLNNTADADPQYQPLSVLAKAATGFTIEWNNALDSANYVLEWTVVGHNDP